MHLVLVLVAPGEDYQSPWDPGTNMQLAHFVTMHDQLGDTVIANVKWDFNLRIFCGD